MGISISSATGGGPDVTRRNLTEVIYFKGDEFTDLSIRMIKGVDNVVELQTRINGVWNVSKLEIGAGTLLLGQDLSLAAIGSHLQISSVAGSNRFLSLDIEFDDIGSLQPRTPVLGQRINRLVLQPIFTDENTTKLATRPTTILTNNAGFAYTIYLKTGSIAATTSIQLSITKGLTLGGSSFFEREYPASNFPSNTEIQLDLISGLGFIAGEEILITFSSDENFSLLGDASNKFFFAIDFQPRSQVDLLSNILTFSRELDVTLDRELNFVVGRTF